MATPKRTDMTHLYFLLSTTVVRNTYPHASAQHSCVADIYSHHSSERHIYSASKQSRCEQCRACSQRLSRQRHGGTYNCREHALRIARTTRISLLSNDQSDAFEHVVRRFAPTRAPVMINSCTAHRAAFAAEVQQRHAHQVRGDKIGNA